MFLRNCKLLSWPGGLKTEDILLEVRLRSGLLVSGGVVSIWISVSTLCLIELLFLFIQSKNVKCDLFYGAWEP